MKQCLLLLSAILLSGLTIRAENGYRLWLRYEKVKNTRAATFFQGIYFPAASATLQAARAELKEGLQQMWGISPEENEQNAGFLCGTPATLPALHQYISTERLKLAGDEGFVLQSVSKNGRNILALGANTDKGILYGIFHLLRLLQTGTDISSLHVLDTPAVKYRLLNHWDNLNGTVERGYAGMSLWDWHRLPGYIDHRYIDYARANASIGINGTVLTNVNANALVLTPPYLEKVAALANAFRPYGIRVYLTARFNAPMELGGLPTADPLDTAVQRWWKAKIHEIYTYVPDFGGFVVKANSEGQPGPQHYGRTHADGANMLAAALPPHQGIVMWRAFVYDNNIPEDRAKQAYTEFKPLDGKFRGNVMVQVKNGAIDFQPREPFHPLFGAMKHTPVMMEFQITQEYLGFATHLVYLAPLYKECLDAVTNGNGTTVSGHIQGMAGVANIGADVNWCGHPFAAANWYAFGRLAWNPHLSADAIASEWLRMTFCNDSSFVEPVKRMMLASREAAVNYMTPLGLHHLMAYGHHYGPGPWVANKPRADWTAVYYHQADSAGIGFDRSSTGSNALAQYDPVVRARFESPGNCPDAYLLWFHHVSWQHRMHSGQTLWESLVAHYYAGAATVADFEKQWASLAGKIDQERHTEVQQLLAIQASEARWWRDACVSYFQSVSHLPLPAGYAAPAHSLEYYKELQFHFVPGI